MAEHFVGAGRRARNGRVAQMRQDCHIRYTPDLYHERSHQVRCCHCTWDTVTGHPFGCWQEVVMANLYFETDESATRGEPFKRIWKAIRY
jgi:hypothetical protein